MNLYKIETLTNRNTSISENFVVSPDIESALLKFVELLCDIDTADMSTMSVEYIGEAHLALIAGRVG